LLPAAKCSAAIVTFKTSKKLKLNQLIPRYSPENQKLKQPFSDLATSNKVAALITQLSKLLFF